MAEAAQPQAQKRHSVNKTALWLAAIAGIVFLDAIALINGIDGQLLTTCIGAIVGIAGYATGRYKHTKSLEGAQ